MRLIDLSVSVAENPLDPNIGEIEQWTHDLGPARIGSAFAPFLAQLAEDHSLPAVPKLDASAFPDGVFLSNEIVRLAVHGGTHMDAPYHYGPICEGHPARRIDEIPLDWCFGDGVRLSFAKGPLEVITAGDVEHELDRIGYALKPSDIVLVETGWDALWPKPDYFHQHPAMTVEATRWLVERGVKVIGIDTNGFDLPTKAMIEAYALSGETNHLWPCHMYGRKVEYLQIERLGGLSQIPVTHGFKVACFPIRVEGAGAGWVRPVAMLEH